MCTRAVTGEIIDMCYNAYAYNHGSSGNVSMGVRTGSQSATA